MCLSNKISAANCVYDAADFVNVVSIYYVPTRWIAHFICTMSRLIHQQQIDRSFQLLTVHMFGCVRYTSCLQSHRWALSEWCIAITLIVLLTQHIFHTQHGRRMFKPNRIPTSVICLVAVVMRTRFGITLILHGSTCQTSGLDRNSDPITHIGLKMVDGEWWNAWRMLNPGGRRLTQPFSIIQSETGKSHTALSFWALLLLHISTSFRRIWHTSNQVHVRPIRSVSHLLLCTAILTSSQAH